MRVREVDIIQALRDRAEDPLEFPVVSGVPVDLYDRAEEHAYLAAVPETLERKLGRAALLLGRAPRVSLAVPSREVDEVRLAAEEMGIGLLSYRNGELETVVEPEERDVDPEVEAPWERAEELAELLKAVSDERRLTALRLLEHGEECLCKIAEALGESEPSTVYHLNQLLEAGLLEKRSEGGKTFYRLTERGRIVVQALRRLEDRLRPGSRPGE